MTLFTVPKAFSGPVGEAQERAIRSWLQCAPGCEILVLGDEDGTEAVARKYGLHHVPSIECNEFGTPLVSSIFGAAERESASRLLCYINTDIILASNIVRAVEAIPFRQFLVVGRRWDLNPEHIPDLAQPGWLQRLKAQVMLYGSLQIPDAMDYFVYTRRLWPAIPPFAVGRTAWDNWLAYRARASHIPVIDATAVVWAIHQNHGYSRPGWRLGIKDGPEVARNRSLAAPSQVTFTSEDATWLLTADGLTPALTAKHIHRRADRLPVLYPRLGPTVQHALRLGRRGRRLFRSIKKRLPGVGATTHIA